MKYKISKLHNSSDVFHSKITGLFLMFTKLTNEKLVHRCPEVKLNAQHVLH